MEKVNDSAKLEFRIRSTILDRSRLLVIDPQIPEYAAAADGQRNHTGLPIRVYSKKCVRPH